MTLILASSSIYRLQLLRDAGFYPMVVKPNTDEEKVKRTLISESPKKIAETLAYLKCESVAKACLLKTEFTVIGSDQVCVLEGQIFDKPETFENNFKQLKLMQNKTHCLLTSVCIMSKTSKSDAFETFQFFNKTELTMKPLTDFEIKDYLEKDKPFDCAGGYKFESLGGSLISKVVTEDPTSIQGLPMKQTMSYLKNLGF